MKKYIAIIGGIAVGKTTIGNEICNNLSGTKFIQEDVLDNEFLPDFYSDMKKWAFHSRISTLAMISSNYCLNNENYKYILMDRCLDELINFAELQYNKNNMSEREFSVYKTLQKNLVKLAPPINYFIYCYCSPETSLQRIKLRDREFEQKIDIEYITNLNKIYDNWVNGLDKDKVIKVNTETSIKSIVNQLLSIIN